MPEGMGLAPGEVYGQHNKLVTAHEAASTQRKEYKTEFREPDETLGMEGALVVMYDAHHPERLPPGGHLLPAEYGETRRAMDRTRQRLSSTRKRHGPIRQRISACLSSRPPKK
jgi:hypothetical protein